MQAVQRTLLVIGVLILTTQSIRHIYIKWIEPREGVLASFADPLNKEVQEAQSLDELVRKYEPIHKEIVERKAKGEVEPRYESDDYNREPWKSERTVRGAIMDWESKSNEVNELRFFWFCGLGLLLVGLAIFPRANRWVGLALIVAAFSEMVYWTSPSFGFGGAAREFDRLLTNKIVFSLLSLTLLLGVWFVVESRRAKV